MIGQMVMIGFRGMTMEEMGPAAEQIRSLQLGGVVLFDYDVPSGSPVRNIRSSRQLRRLTHGLQTLSPDVPLLIAIDQEGGRVSRLKEKFGFPPTVSAEYLGKKNDLELTRSHGETTASLLKNLGINFNFAPVVDVNVNPENPVIGKIERSFSRDPKTVAVHAEQIIKAHHQQEVICAIKHFPGHGSSRSDSHHGFTDVTQTWAEGELAPFAVLINKGLADAVMTAHIFNEHLDPKYPATLSGAVLSGILREQMGYEGVIITDDLQMGAIRGEYGFQEAVLQSLRAGADILLFANNSVYDPYVGDKAVRTIRELVNTGLIDREHVARSYARIMALKNKYLEEKKDDLS